ncbi:restriction endonuclease [Leptospira levettii]|uniref:PmeII family type II restriction endonuclease n=1 Tax=Leptospira levettii TaxID=2023178 RepID=UPI001083B860|nr:PmeII family type II restriction endonuclease [Leptospira levettii]TGL23130.1 restriction endonuclease [Leptospira levettii]
MDKKQKREILDKTKIWFRDVIAINHIENTKKLADINEFNVNPFLATYLANFLTGNSNPESIAKALIYPRALGTSITTSFGTNIQKFTSDVLSAFKSTTSGIDIEFEDSIDGIKRYCQLKAGPNTINKDDVETIAGHFRGIIQLAKTNGLKLSYENFSVCLIYGNQNEISGHYKRITDQYHYPVIIGKDFWHRLTGEAEFYFDLIKTFAEVASESDFKKELEKVIRELSKSTEIQNLSKKT